MKIALLRASMLRASVWVLVWVSASSHISSYPQLEELIGSLLAHHLQTAGEDEVRSVGATAAPNAAQLNGVQEKTLHVYGRPVRLLIVRPSQGVGQLPGLLLFQAGGNPNRLATADIARAMSTIRADFCTVLVASANGNQSTDSISPADAYFVTKWVVEHGTQLGIDGQRLAVFGVSPALPTRAPLVGHRPMAFLGALEASAGDDPAAPGVSAKQPVRMNRQRRFPALAPSSWEPEAPHQPYQLSARTS